MQPSRWLWPPSLTGKGLSTVPRFRFLYYLKAPRAHWLQQSLPAPAGLLLCRTGFQFPRFPSQKFTAWPSQCSDGCRGGKSQTRTLCALNLVFQPRHSDNNQQPVLSKEPWGYRRKLRREKGAPHLLNQREGSVLLLKTALKELIHTHSHKHAHTHALTHPQENANANLLLYSIPCLLTVGSVPALLACHLCDQNSKNMLLSKQGKSWRERCGPLHPHPLPVYAEKLLSF